MKIKLIIIILCLLLFSCGGGSDNDDIDYYYQIVSWQYRELASPNIETRYRCTGNIYFDIINIIYNNYNSWYYVSEEIDYWNTSYESLIDKNGDCEDAAILAYRTIEDSCLVDEGVNTRLQIIDSPGPVDHMIAIVYYENTEVEISNMIVSVADPRKKVITEFDMYNIYY